MKKINSIFFVVLSLLLVGCSSSDNVSISDVEDKANRNIETLTEEIGEVCNNLSDGNIILLNKPCDNDQISNNLLQLSGKIINEDQIVLIKISQAGKSVFAKEIFPVPTDAAGAYKLINEELQVEGVSPGIATLRISQGNESVSVDVNFN